MKIFVAIPSYDPRLQIEVVNCLLNEQKIALGIGDDFTVMMLSGDAGIVGARNQCVSKFFETDFDRFFFLDADITWEVGALVKLAHMPYDFVGGAYRYKMEVEDYPINWLPDDPDTDGMRWNEHKLLEVQKLPTGFLALSRKVFQTIMDAHPERIYKHFGHPSFTFFQLFFKDGALVGEDYLFCEEWASLGGKIYLDPEIKLTHWGINPTPNVGHIGNWLKKLNGITVETKEQENVLP